MRRSLIFVSVATAAFALVALPQPSLADPVPLVAGTRLHALKQTTVKILEEDLSLELSPKTLKVRATLLLKNDGPAISFPVGFPCDQGNDDIAGLSCKSILHIDIGKKHHAPSLKTVEEYGKCWVWDMTFKAGEEVILDIEYSAPIVNDRYSIPLAGIYFAYYPLRTGANWEGPIGELTMRVRTPAETIILISPRGYTRTPGLIEWRLSNYEPAEDLYIIFSPMKTEEYLAGMSAKAKHPEGVSRADWLMKFSDEFGIAMGEHARAYEQLLFLTKQAPSYSSFKLPDCGPMYEELWSTVSVSCHMMRNVAQEHKR